ncbi:MAG TPA: hypothetical protein VGE00_06665 [Gammaproteobacteria bacterium]
MTNKQELTSLLGRWYADPLTQEEASALLAAAETRRSEQLRQGRSCHVCRLQQMIAHYWLGREIDEEFHAFRHRLRKTAHGRILVELIYGQLLMSQRRPGAMQALNNAFHSARNLLSPSDYFVLFKRHNLLDKLPLGTEGQNGLSLEELLTTAAVIERMTKARQTVGRRDDGSSL